MENWCEYWGLSLMLSSRLYRTEVILYDSLICDFMSLAKLGCGPEVLWDFFYTIYMDGCHDMSCGSNWKLYLWGLLCGAFMCTWVWRTILFSGCLLRNRVWSLWVLWYGTQLCIYVLRRGCLGTCLWEWLAVGVRDPKWSVPRWPIASYVISDNLVINNFGEAH